MLVLDLVGLEASLNRLEVRELNLDVDLSSIVARLELADSLNVLVAPATNTLVGAYALNRVFPELDAHQVHTMSVVVAEHISYCDNSLVGGV